LLRWLLREHIHECAIQAEWADPNRFPLRTNKLEERVGLAIEYFPCDILFVHRDAENEGYDFRLKEIETARTQITNQSLRCVPVIPVRMMEAWLFVDELAIRKASGNPNGTIPLDLPADPESIADPKTLLHKTLEKASELTARRLKKFRPHERTHLIPDNISDFTPLRRLSAFTNLESELSNAIAALGLQAHR
jgi:hypothetical protein